MSRRPKNDGTSDGTSDGFFAGGVGGVVARVVSRALGREGGTSKNRAQSEAAEAEAQGELEVAAERFMKADLPHEAARVLLLRGDGELDAGLRLAAYTRAVSLASSDADLGRKARVKRGRLLQELTAAGTQGPGLGQLALEAAEDLEAVGEHEAAARLYGALHHAEAQARALARSGDVDGLEALLSREGSRESQARKAQGVLSEADLFVSIGRRREALALLEGESKNPEGVSRAQGLRARRALGPLVRVVAGGEALTLALGREVVVGRTEGALRVTSSAVSRQHAVICRREGGFVVKSAGGKNGLQLRGMEVAEGTEVTVGDGVEVTLGREVPLRLEPSTRVPGALEVRVAGACYVVPCGPCTFAGEARGLTLDVADDGWVELSVAPGAQALQGDVAMVPRVTVLVGDTFATLRGGAPALRVVGG